MAISSCVQSTPHSFHCVQMSVLMKDSSTLLILVSVIGIAFSAPEGGGDLSSIVCQTAAAAGIGKVPVKVVIDSFHVTTPKMFFYETNPVITSVYPRCSLQR